MSDDAKPVRTVAEARGRAIALLAFLALAKVFIVVSAWDIVVAVFPSNERAASLEPSPACASAARLYGVASERLDETGDEARANSGAGPLDAAERSLRQACAGSASDLDIEAATLRAARMRHSAQRHAAMAPLP